MSSPSWRSVTCRFDDIDLRPVILAPRFMDGRPCPNMRPVNRIRQDRPLIAELFTQVVDVPPRVRGKEDIMQPSWKAGEVLTWVMFIFYIVKLLLISKFYITHFCNSFQTHVSFLSFEFNEKIMRKRLLRFAHTLFFWQNINLLICIIYIYFVHYHRWMHAQFLEQYTVIFWHIFLVRSIHHSKRNKQEKLSRY